MPINKIAAIWDAPPPTPTKLQMAPNASSSVKTTVGLTGRADLSSGKGPNQIVEKRRREKTAKFDASLDARTVEAESAAVRESVEGSFAGERGVSMVGIAR